jgi:hypothetical protein
MADIWIKARIKGKKEQEIDMLANTKKGDANYQILHQGKW